MNATPSRILLAVIAGWIVLETGCSRSAGPGVGQTPVIAERKNLSAAEAAQMAARLANDQCERQYRKRPFNAGQHSAVFQDGTYRWGGLDVGGPGGLSALVTFRRDGSEPHVEVYLSSDALRQHR